MDKYARFEAWLRDNGARFEQLELREYDCASSNSNGEDGLDATMSLGGGGEEKKETTMDTADDENEGRGESEMRGVHARTMLPPNTICMSIPRRCLITVEMGQATPIGQAIYNSELDLDAPKHIYLMVYILWDRKVHGRHSFFAPYYDILPQTLSNMPIFWSPEELALLEGSYLLHQIADRNQAIAEDYHAICSIAPALQQICTLEEFKWARMCVCSRNFGLQMDGHRTSALVPHADMLNHYRPRETKWTFDEERNAFTITTLQAIPAGAQVYDSYGQKCNHRFLLNYGFAVEDNREMDGFCPNEVPLELYVDPDDPNYIQKLEFWTRGEVNPHSPAVLVAAAAAAAAGSVSHSLLTQAVSQLQQQQQPERQSSRTQPAPHHPAHQRYPQHYPSSAASSFHAASSNMSSFGESTVIKRIRVCVSNNENTRLLFSLLRTLACNEAELKAITRNGGSSSLSSNDRAVALFGFPDSLRGSSHQTQAKDPQLVLTGSPSPTAYYRSCRDLRHPLSLRNETAAMQLLLNIVQRHLAMYPTTLEQDIHDLEDLQKYPRFSNQRHAKIQVRGEKQVLHHFMNWARTALTVLDVIRQEMSEARGDGGATAVGSVEVRLNTRTGQTTVSSDDGTSMQQQLQNGSHFEHLIRRMEEQEGDDYYEATTSLDNSHVIHHTILRYCSDVLGSLRREEMKNLVCGQSTSRNHRSALSSSHRMASGGPRGYM